MPKRRVNNSLIIEQRLVFSNNLRLTVVGNLHTVSSVVHFPQPSENRPRFLNSSSVSGHSTVPHLQPPSRSVAHRASTVLTEASMYSTYDMYGPVKKSQSTSHVAHYTSKLKIFGYQRQNICTPRISISVSSNVTEYIRIDTSSSPAVGAVEYNPGRRIRAFSLPDFRMLSHPHACLFHHPCHRTCTSVQYLTQMSLKKAKKVIGWGQTKMQGSCVVVESQAGLVLLHSRHL